MKKKTIFFISIPVFLVLLMNINNLVDYVKLIFIPSRAVYNGTVINNHLDFIDANNFTHKKNINLKSILKDQQCYIRSVNLTHDKLTLLCPKEDNNDLLVVQISSTDVKQRIIPSGAIKPMLSLAVTKMGCWVSVDDDVYLINQEFTDVQKVITDYSFSLNGSCILPYDDNGILYATKDGHVKTYPQQTEFFVLQRGEHLAGWAKPDGTLFLSGIKGTFIVDLQGNKQRKFSNKGIDNYNNVHALVPKQAGNPDFIDIEGIQENISRNESIFEYQGFIYDAMTNEVKKLPFGSSDEYRGYFYDSFDEEALQAIQNTIDENDLQK
jgi:hypothetical protein